MLQTKAIFEKWKEEVPEVVYHYCSPEAFLGIFQSGEIWISSAHHQNDRSERIYAGELLRSVVSDLVTQYYQGAEENVENAALRLIERAEDARSYLACFSEKPDLLSQWRAYTPRTGGFGIGFATKKFTSGGDWLFTRCEYDPTKQRRFLEEVLQEHLPLLDPTLSVDTILQGNMDPMLPSLIAALLTIIPSVKHPMFSEEAEWRLVRNFIEAEKNKVEFRIANGHLIPYQRVALAQKGERLPIVEVVIGPSPDAEDRTSRATRMLLDQYDLRSCDLRVSKIPYRGW